MSARWNRIAGGLLMAATAVFMLAPLVVVVLVSFSPSPVFNLPEGQWSLRWYRAMLAKEGLADTVLLSAAVAAGATLAALVLGTLCAIAIEQGHVHVGRPPRHHRRYHRDRRSRFHPHRRNGTAAGRWVRLRAPVGARRTATDAQ